MDEGQDGDKNYGDGCHDEGVQRNEGNYQLIKKGGLRCSPSTYDAMMSFISYMLW